MKCGSKCKWALIGIGALGIAYITDFMGIKSKIQGRGKKMMPLPYGPSPDVVRDMRAGGAAPYAETLGHNVVALYKPPFGSLGGDAADPNQAQYLKQSMAGYRPRAHQRISLS